ncbi:unnamed protein product [Lupinus luteus]|uniref:WAT1-related protein n=1 Tax=Lupinus luteus TaxID=3873 RepID=A0AAV1WAR9_LUPLU
MKDHSLLLEFVATSSSVPFLGHLWYNTSSFWGSNTLLQPLLVPFSTWCLVETVNIKLNSGKAKILGTFVCIGGALLLTLYKGKPLFNFSQSYSESVAPASPATRSIGKWTIGVIALTLGTLFLSSWFILQSKVVKKYPCKYSSTAIMTFFGAIQSAVICFSTSRNLSIWVVKEKIQLLTILYAGVVGSGLCFAGTSWCVKKRGPVFTAAFSPLVQIMSAIVETPLMHEQLYLGR